MTLIVDLFHIVQPLPPLVPDSYVYLIEILRLLRCRQLGVRRGICERPGASIVHTFQIS